MLKRKFSYATLERQYENEKEEILGVVNDVFQFSQYIMGKDIEILESELAYYCNVKYCLTLNSGTDALILGMKALGITEGDEVITPPNSFVASTAAIVHVGAKPVFVDVGDDQNIDVSQIEDAITSKTKAIMPVHLTGRVCDMNAIKEIADRHGLFIIEDAAQAFGSKYDNKMSGSFGDVGCFSAHPLKIFNACGDAGFITTNSTEVWEKIKLLRAHGLLDRNTVQEWGYVSRLDNLQAAILRHRLKKIDAYIEGRRKNRQTYKEILDPEVVYIPACKEKEYNSFQTMVIRVKNRDDLQKYLKEEGIETSVHYPVPIHLQPAAKSLGHKVGDFPNTEQQAREILSIPASNYLTSDEIVYIGEKINGFFKSKKITLKSDSGL